MCTFGDEVVVVKLLWGEGIESFGDEIKHFLLHKRIHSIFAYLDRDIAVDRRGWRVIVVHPIIIQYSQYCYLTVFKLSPHYNLSYNYHALTFIIMPLIHNYICLLMSLYNLNICLFLSHTMNHMPKYHNTDLILSSLLMT